MAVLRTLFIFSLLFLSSFIYLSVALPPEADLITSLPGLNDPINFKQYAGYVNITETKFYFYWFVESQNDPSTDPVILWLNGGPGCSSLLGFLGENGPFSPNEQKQLNLNPWSWNTVANVLYLESPVEVGFSYSTVHPGVYTDNRTAEDNYNVLLDWFAAFSNYTSNDFYISGESYAGHYIPTLVDLIVTKGGFPNFKGFLVGNPSTTSNDDGESLTEYLKYHTFLPLTGRGSGDSGNYNPYDILVDVCEGKVLSDYVRFPNRAVDMFKKHFPKEYVPNPPPCIDNYMSAYLNQPEVQSAIHARHTKWIQCGGPSYNFGPPTVKYYIDFMNNTNIKILVYSGDADTVINFVGTETWIAQLGRHVEKSWRPWNYIHNKTSQLAGFEVIYDRITYKTVKGAGHMVPGYQPIPALTMLKSFIESN